MSTELTLTQDDKELITTLQNSLYTGARQESILMVLSYCKASGLDPMQKPVHIVPMYDRSINGMRDVIMPGIGLYRTTAARTGEMAGVTEPEFGEDVTMNLGGADITFPKYCKVTVSRLLKNGTIVNFTAKELWIENYATAKKDTALPNAMWKKRPYAQLAKCAEAQALRKAFPEVGSSPTADEMEGKPIDITETASHTIAEENQAQIKTKIYSFAEFEKNCDTWRGLIESGKYTVNNFIAFVESKGRTFTDSQKSEIASWQKLETVIDVDNETGEVIV